MLENITSDDILGKEAVDPDGTVLGTVVKLHVSNKTKQVIGITVDMGFLKPDLFIGIDYVKYFGVDAVLLNTVPTMKIKGMKVMLSNGKEIGTVKEVKLFRKRVKEIIVTTHKSLMSHKHITISAKQIYKIGGSVVLKDTYKPPK